MAGQGDHGGDVEAEEEEEEWEHGEDEWEHKEEAAAVTGGASRADTRRRARGASSGWMARAGDREHSKGVQSGVAALQPPSAVCGS